MPREKSIAERFDAYVERVGGRLYKPCRRFLREALFGLVDKRSVLLSQIGRALREDSRLIHTEKRLSRNLANKRYDDAAVEEDYLRLVAPILRDERYPRPVIAVDLTDIAKSRARKMPYLYKVHDGSKDEIAKGYQVVSIEAVGVRGRRLPLVSRLFSQSAPGFKSQNATTLEAVATVAPHVPEDAFWVFDSGFDGRVFLERLDGLGISYAVRVKLSNNRFVHTPEGKMKVRELVELLPQPHTHRTKYHRPDITGRRQSLKLGFVRDVHLPKYTSGGRPSKRKLGERRYSLVVAQGIGLKPLVILTTEDVQTKEDAARVVDIYLERWGIEEANRFLKQGFKLEMVRALTWTGLKRMVQLVHLAYGFLALLVHGPRAQVERIASTFKAFGPVPEYMYYRLLEGIGELLRATMDGGP
ncbi:transposase [Archangium violaceum]|uniref:transposase n=1 Tax=Archangium violaceum TaxID=83451 RepID=UPI0019515F4D|nr:transposase [Archangium violaceum]QRN97416.1 transposase [Archangium violaceum]